MPNYPKQIKTSKVKKTARQDDDDDDNGNDGDNLI